jgi:hypothetical protein
MMKQNIISGLLLFSISITIGPYLMRGLSQEEAMVNAQSELREAFGELRAARTPIASESEDAALGDNGDAVRSEASLAEVDILANAAARASTAHVNYYFAQFRQGNLTMTHAHGNLQGMLNILIGLFLANLAISKRQQLIISWGFIVGSWTMVGSLLLGNVFDLRWAFAGIYPGGIILILSLFALTFAVIVKGFGERAQS